MEKHPVWKNAAEIISDRVIAEGYGVLIAEADLLDMLRLEKPEESTYDEYKRFSLNKLAGVESLKTELLNEFNLCLSSVHGKGYTVLHPKDQVTKEPEYRYRRIGGQIRMAIRVLMNVNAELLDLEAQESRNNNLGRLAFIRSAMRKKSILPFVDKKKIEA